MQKLPLKQHRNTSPIAPGGDFPISCVGSNFFYTLSASHPNFDLVLNDDVTVSGRLALGHIFPEGTTVDKIRVVNRDASRALTISIVTGKGRPLDEGLNVYTEQVTPTVRQENPSSFSFTSVEIPLSGRVQLLPLDCARAEVLLFTEDGDIAYYGPTDSNDWPLSQGNQVGLTLDGATRLRTCAPIYVRGADGVRVYAYVFSY